MPSDQLTHTHTQHTPSHIYFLSFVLTHLQQFSRMTSTLHAYTSIFVHKHLPIYTHLPDVNVAHIYKEHFTILNQSIITSLTLSYIKFILFTLTIFCLISTFKIFLNCSMRIIQYIVTQKYTFSISMLPHFENHLTSV